MPIALACSCGKQFKVKDDALGTVVTCQVCGKAITVAAPAESDEAVPVLKAAAPAILKAPATKTCPACAEDIPAAARRCPHCDEDLAASVPAEGQAEALAARVIEVEAHVKNLDTAHKDAELMGGFLSTKSKVILAFEGLGALGLLSSAVAGRDAEMFGVFGVLLLLFFTIPVIVTLVNDARCRGIQQAKTATAAMKKFLLAVTTNRTKPAFVALAPSARNVTGAKSITFTNKKIPAHTGTYAISDPASLGAYWKSILTGPSGNTRSVRVKSVRVVRETAGVALVEAELECTSYSSWIILTVFIGLLICLIIILATQQKETVTVRKVLINRGGRWFLAESELKGPLDCINSSVLNSTRT